jgi:aspartate aminotransferase/aminotransferase
MNNRIKKMNVSGVRKMFEMASKMNNPVNLSLGLPDFDVPLEIKNAAIGAIKKGHNKYSPTTGIDELKEKIIKKLKRENNISVSLDELIITSSASGALSIILTTIINEEDEIIIFDPYFVSYKQLIIQNGGIPVYAKTNDDFSMNLKDFESKITRKTKAVIINSPNNPTGKVYDEAELKKLAAIVKKHNLLIISDEIYEKFCYEKNHFSIGSIYKNTVTINGFSKTYAMTGWRIGYCVAPCNITREAVKVQQFNFVCAPTPFQYAAIKALDVDIKNYINFYRKKRDVIYNKLKNKYELVKPDGAFYAFIKYPYDGDEFIKNCIKKNLLVVPGNVFSENNTHFRISFANKNNELEKGVKILNKLV